MAEIKLFNRDCIAAMKDIEDGSIDLIVTDPPYMVVKSAFYFD